MRKTIKNPQIIRLLVGFLGIFLVCSCNTTSFENLTVMEGQFRQSFTETGDLAAIKSKAVPMPRISYQYGYEFKIVQLVSNGTHVKKGDTIAKLDDSTIHKYIITKQEALENEMAASNKQEVECKNAIQDLEAQLKAEQAINSLNKLKLERAQFDTDQKRKIKELEFQKGTIRLNKLERKLKMKPIMNGYDQKIQRIKILQKEADLKGASEALERMVIISPEDGLFQVGYSMFQYPPRDLQVGDAVYQGALIARIPDITRMRVNTHVNEADYMKIHLGTKVIVRLDALPSVAFHGVVTYINKICLPRDKEKVFKVQVEIEESDLRLKPGMTMSCEFIRYEDEKKLYVPNKCLLKENGHAYVFINKGSKPKRVEVVAGPSNNNHTVISGNVRPGQKLIPFETILKQKSI